MKTYTTGKPCKYGHTGPRYRSNGCCVQCLREKHRHRVDALSKEMQPQPFMTRPVDRLTVQQLCDILQYAPPRVVDILKRHISDIHSDPNTYI
jgi:hypothetical protein